MTLLTMSTGDVLFSLYVTLALVPLWTFGWSKLPRTYYAGLIVLTIFSIAAWLASPSAMVALYGEQPGTFETASRRMPTAALLLFPIGSILVGTGYLRLWIVAAFYTGIGMIISLPIAFQVETTIGQVFLDILTWPYWIMLIFGLFGDRAGWSIG